MGIYYTKKFSEEIDRNLKNKISMPAYLLSKRDINITTVINIDSFENILQEKIHDVFVVKPDGTIYYSAKSEREGNYYKEYLDKEEKKLFKEINTDFLSDQIIYHKHGKKNFISILSRLENRKHFIGVLYINLDGDVIASRKKEIILFFLFGSLITVVATSLFEALILHHLFVPRINKTRAALSLVEQGNLSVRIPHTDSADQLGSLIRHVNRMIAATERNTRLLKMVNEAGASFVTADSLEQLSELITKEVSTLQRYVKKTSLLDQNQKQNIIPASLALDPYQGFQLPLPDQLTSRKKGMLHMPVDTFWMS